MCRVANCNIKVILSDFCEPDAESQQEDEELIAKVEAIYLLNVDRRCRIYSLVYFLKVRVFIIPSGFALMA